MEIKKKKQYSKFVEWILEPLGVALTIAIFSISTLAVVNLSAETKYFPVSQEVMGVADEEAVVETSDSALQITLVGGVHQFISAETMTKDSENHFSYTASISKRDVGTYSKPFVRMANNTSDPIEIYFSGGLATDSSSKVGVIYNNSNYLIQSPDGNIFKSPIVLNAGESTELYLFVANTNDVLFSDNLSVNIFTK